MRVPGLRGRLQLNTLVLRRAVLIMEAASFVFFISCAKQWNLSLGGVVHTGRVTRSAPRDAGRSDLCRDAAAQNASSVKQGSVFG